MWEGTFSNFTRAKKISGSKIIQEKKNHLIGLEQQRNIAPGPHANIPMIWGKERIIILGRQRVHGGGGGHLVVNTQKTLESPTESGR